eukprot:scaffold3378_cov82-Skeletonema_dohrnii-CCMP3373.AAC.1
MGDPLEWLIADNPSVEDAEAFIENHPDALMGIENDYGSFKVPLHIAIVYRASDDVILFLLEACPQAAAAKDTFGFLPLRHAINSEDTMCSEEVIAALINAHPGAASERDSRTGNLPLHDAVNKNASEGIILSLIKAYPQAAFEMKDGRLLVEIYLERKASDDFMREICKVCVRVDGLLPLGVVLTKRSSDDIVLAVLEAYPEAARKRFSTKFDECILPLHIAFEDKHSEPVKDALRRVYPDAEKYNPFETTHQLHKLLENESLSLDHRAYDEVKKLIEKYPEAAGKRGRDGRLPLHIAIDRIASYVVTWMLFEAYLQAGKEKMKDGRLPIEVIAEQEVTEGWFQESLTRMATRLLNNDMPVSIEDGTPVEHSGSWHACISYSTETATCAVRKILLDSEKRDTRGFRGSGFGKHIHALADAYDANGRSALGLASSGPRDVIYEYLLFCGRYKLQIGPPEHHTATSVILRAQDLYEKADYDAIFEEADDNGNGKLDRKELKAITVKIGLETDLFLKGSKESDESISKETFVGICNQLLGDGPRKVVIKLMKNKDHWKRERRAREEYNLSPKYVVSTLPNAPSDTEIDKAVKTGRGGLKTIQEKFLKDIVLGKHAIVMGAGPRNLLQIFYQEQPKTDAVRDMLRQVFEAVKHLHEKNLMHGDIKMLNIIRLGIDNKLRLIDFDASARIVPSGGEEESFAGAGAKFSSAILPPEMIERIETEEHLEKFKKYWKSEIDEDLKKKVEAKLYKKQGTVKARYVVKSFRTEEGKPVFEGLPYTLVGASENIDLWSLGVLAFTLLTGETLIPSTRDDDCLSGAAMHLLKSWGTQPEELIDRFKKIQNDAARELVGQLLQKEPADRPRVASLLDKHPFFHPERVDEEMKGNVREMKVRLENMDNSLQSQAKQLEKMNANILVIKQLSYKNQSELLRTRHVLLKGIFKATEVRTPTTFIVLHNKLPPEPSDGDREKMLDFVTKDDGSGVSVQTKHASMTFSAEGVDMKLQGDLEERYERAQDGIEWVKRIKRIGSKVAAGEIGMAFEIIKEEIIKENLVGNEMYLYLIDELTGEPVRAEGEGWPIVITTPSELVHKLLPLMMVGMRAMSIYNGTAGMARLFGYPLPKVPKAWLKGAQESVELLKKESSVEDFSVVHEEVKGGSEEEKSVRGASLRTFVDFLNEKDPGLKDGKTGHYAGLRRIGDPDQGTALWTMLTDPGDIKSALKKRAKQYEEEERTQNEHNQHGKMAKVKVVTQEEINEETSGTEEVHEFAELNDTRNAVAASKEIDELIRAAKEATASLEEATAAANAAASAPAAAQDVEEVAKLIKQAATAAAKEVVSAPTSAQDSEETAQLIKAAATAAAKEAACCTIL